MLWSGVFFWGGGKKGGNEGGHGGSRCQGVTPNPPQGPCTHRPPRRREEAAAPCRAGSREGMTGAGGQRRSWGCGAGGEGNGGGDRGSGEGGQEFGGKKIKSGAGKTERETRGGERAKEEKVWEGRWSPTAEGWEVTRWWGVDWWWWWCSPPHFLGCCPHPLSQPLPLATGTLAQLWWPQGDVNFPPLSPTGKRAAPWAPATSFLR